MEHRFAVAEATKAPSVPYQYDRSRSDPGPGLSDCHILVPIWQLVNGALFGTELIG